MITFVLIGLLLVPAIGGLYANWRKWRRDPMRPLSDTHVLRTLNTQIDRPRRARRNK